MATATSKVNIAQTATHAAAVLTAAGVDNIDAFREIRDEILKDLEAFKEEEVQEKVANFGSSIVPPRYKKHAGKTWDQVLSDDPGYVHWLATKEGGDADDRRAAGDFLRSKGMEPTKGYGRS